MPAITAPPQTSAHSGYSGNTYDLSTAWKLAARSTTGHFGGVFWTVCCEARSEVHAIYLALRHGHIWPGSLVRGHPAGWRMVRNLPGPPKLFGVFNLPRHQEVRCWLLSLEPSAPASSCRSWSDRACLKHLHPHCVACCGNHCAHESAYPSSDHPLAYTRAQDTQPMHLARRAATVRSSLLPHRA